MVLSYTLFLITLQLLKCRRSSGGYGNTHGPCLSSATRLLRPTPQRARQGRQKYRGRYRFPVAPSSWFCVGLVCLICRPLLPAAARSSYCVKVQC